MKRQATDLPEPAPHDTAPEVSDEAARMLDLLLSQPPGGLVVRTQLVVDWLQLAEASSQRVPHQLLARLLSFANANPSVAPHLRPAIGIRGQWLLGLMPTAKGQRPATTANWAELQGADAASALELLRGSDPAAARGQLDTHWTTLSARERAVLLAKFSTNLHGDDEQLLERALDDKAKSVRDVAAGLLDRLPTSARAGRMAARLHPLVHFKGLLGKRIEIDLPPEPDAAAVRDGIAPAPRQGEPDRLGRLDAIVRGAPLDVWTSVTGRSPASTLALLEGESRVLEAMTTAAALRPELDWVRALLHVHTDLRLLNCLPAAERGQELVRHIKGGTTQPMALVQLLLDMPRPWGPPLADAVLELIASTDGAQFAVVLSSVLPTALPPEAADHCRLLMERLEDDARRRALRDVVQYRSFLQSLTEAFR